MSEHTIDEVYTLVTVLTSKVDTTNSRLDKMNGSVAQSQRDIAALNTCNAVNERRWTDHEKDHETEAKGLKVYSTVLSSVESLVALVVGVFVNKPGA